MYKKVTEADIEEFESNYRGSESEKNDLIDLYKKYNGHMDRMPKKNFSSCRKLFQYLVKKVGNVYVQFREEEFAAIALKNLSGRYYADQAYSNTNLFSNNLYRYCFTFPLFSTTVDLTSSKFFSAFATTGIDRGYLGGLQSRAYVLFTDENAENVTA